MHKFRLQNPHIADLGRRTKEVCHPPDLRLCPDCGKETKILVSESENNPGRVYIKCKTFKSKLSKCKFFIWEDELEESVHNELEPEVSTVSSYGAQYDVEMREWKKQNSQLVSLVERLKFLVTLIVFLMIIILIVMLCKYACSIEVAVIFVLDFFHSDGIYFWMDVVVNLFKY